MGEKTIFFAGGGTGGHIYPAIAVAEKIIRLAPDCKIHFFVSGRDIDSRILSQTSFEYTKLPAEGFSVKPGKLFRFCSTFVKSYKIANEIISKTANSAVVGAGGFVAAPVCLAAHKRKKPIALLNVDIVPGLANRIIASWANEIFVQFDDTAEHFARTKAKINVVGCPLRSSFENPRPNKVIEQLGLDENKKVLLVTGASSGSQSINETVCSILERLDSFADSWQIVHIAGVRNYEDVKKKYADAKINSKVLSYYDDMADLLACADLVIGRSGAVSVAEFTAAAVPSICMPYPYHKDRHQYLNAGKLVDAGAAIIVDDLPDVKDRAEWLAEELEQLLKDDQRRQQMVENCKAIANLDAAAKIATKLIET